MFETLFGIVMLESAEQCSNAPAPMFLMPHGIIIELRDRQPLNAYMPISITLFGMATLVRESQLLNA